MFKADFIEGLSHLLCWKIVMQLHCKAAPRELINDRKTSERLAAIDSV